MKTTTEYRMVCAAHGKQGHGTHAHPVTAKNYEKKKKSADAWTEELKTRDTAVGRSSYYANEAPWIVQTRTVTEWENIE